MIYFDILQTDKWFSLCLPETPEGFEDFDEPLNAYFDANGFGSKSVILNLGSTAVLIAVFILLHIIAMVLKPCSKVYPRLGKLKEKLHSSLYWDGSLRFLVQQYVPITLSSIISLQSVSSIMKT